MLESLSAIPETQLADLELFLLNLRYKEGRLVNIEGHRPQLLDDEAQVWVVYAGVVDLFAVPVQEGAVSGTRRHLFQARPGQALFGLSSAENGFGLLASGSSGTQLLRIPRQRFWALAAELEFSAHIEAMIDNWVLQLTRALARRVPPKPDLLLNSVKPRILDAGEIVSTNEAVLWTQIRFGEATYFCQPELAFDHTAGNLPLTRFSWLASRLRTQLLTSDTATLLDSQEIEAALSYFHSRVKLLMGSNWQQETAEELDRLQARAAAEQQTMAQALTRLRQPLAASAAAPPQDASQTDLLMAALKPIGAALGLSFRPPHLTPAAETPAYDILEQIVRQSDVRTREVALRGAWWRQDGGPLLALTAAENRPVALIYQGRGYQIFDPLTHEYRPVDLAASVQLGPLAYSFYRPFPNSAVTLRDILRFSLQGNQDSFRLNLVVGVLIALLGLLPPVATGLVFDYLIPEAQVNLLLQMGLGLLATALAMAIFRTVRSLSLIRLLTQVDSSLQAATWDRLLKLPLTFFKEYTAGNLGSRAMGFAQINRIISGHVITTILTGLFSIFNLLLLFYYSPALATVALVLVVVALGVTLVAAHYFLRHHRELSEIQGNLSGLVLQLLTGIAKFRVAGAEHHAFALWSERFAEQKKLYTQSLQVTNRLSTFNAGFFLLASIILFGLIAYSDTIALSTGDFVAFNLAFAQFMGGWMMLGGTMIAVLSVIPMYERLQPILTALPETDESKVHPGELKGNVEVSHLSFRYSEDGPLVLDDVSLKAEQGEFIALVGPSGSGKSTMLRLLLGFETPETGGIFYDDQDLLDLDPRELRQQLGVVLQNATLMNGDIFENIVGASSSLTVEDAWEAARQVGLDADVEKMPMGMHTIVSERGGNLSGGQRQRILIAAAIVNRPRIIFFDEATSALDNRTQAIVSESLEQLQATRIVIAHRLSTIINADRIYVFEKGRIVQSGSYESLIREPGPFAEMARRQIA